MFGIIFSMSVDAIAVQIEQSTPKDIHKYNRSNNKMIITIFKQKVKSFYL
ncbi:MAG: hypothetical protein K0S41_2567 [Anaerocolumna sp.]|jgi:hypothetical protein|nr:hypothetical protein [Anaerocolumna sp.]